MDDILARRVDQHRAPDRRLALDDARGKPDKKDAQRFQKTARWIDRKGIVRRNVALRDDFDVRRSRREKLECRRHSRRLVEAHERSPEKGIRNIHKKKRLGRGRVLEEGMSCKRVPQLAQPRVSRALLSLIDFGIQTRLIGLIVDDEHRHAFEIQLSKRCQRIETVILLEDGE